MDTRTEVVERIRKSEKLKYIKKAEILEFLYSKNIPVDKKESKEELLVKLDNCFSTETVTEFDVFSGFGLIQKELLEMFDVTKGTFGKLCERKHISHETVSIGSNKLIYIYKAKDIITMAETIEKEGLMRKKKELPPIPEPTDENIAKDGAVDSIRKLS